MTVSALNPAEQPVVTGYHMVCLLGCSGVTLNRYIAQGLVPRPDARAGDGHKLWRLSTIRAWRSDLADAAADLVKRPPIRLYNTLPAVA